MAKREIPRGEWNKFFDNFSKQHEEWIVDWEVLDSDFGDQEVTTRLPLVGISADVKGGDGARIAIMVGDTPEAHVTQFIETPKHVWVKDPEQPGHDAIEIESADGTTTLLTFTHIDPDKTERQLPSGT